MDVRRGRSAATFTSSYSRAAPLQTLQADPWGDPMIRTALVATAVSGMAVGGLLLAPGAAAAETITVHELCEDLRPHMKIGVGLTCSTSPSQFVGGTPVVQRAAQYPGAYPVDPANPWSDWVLPGGRASKVVKIGDPRDVMRECRSNPENYCG